jgi:hypothetical protein
MRAVSRTTSDVISHRWRCIFVHQRKSAGTSVKAMFEDAEGPDRGRFNAGVLSPDWDPDDPVVRDYFKFTVVRNPWDRFVSGWRYCRSTRGLKLVDAIAHPPRPSLWANVAEAGAPAGVRLTYARAALREAAGRAKLAARRAAGIAAVPPPLAGHDYRHVTRQQRETVVYPDGRPAMDKVVFFEDLDAGLREVFAAIGRPYAPPPAHRVRRAGDDYRRHFDDRARAAFAARFPGDVAYWGYDFENGLPAALRGQ